MRKIIAIILLLSFSGCLSPAFSLSQYQIQKLDQLEMILNQLTGELNLLQDNYEQQKITLSELRNELEIRQQLLSDYEKEITSLQFSLIESENDSQNLTRQLAQVRAQLAEVQSLLNQAEESLKSYENKQTATKIVIGIVAAVVGFVVGVIAD